MLIQDLISPNVPTLSLADSAEKAIHLMQDYHLTQLPLLNKNKYLGLISEDELLDWDDTELTFANSHVNYFKPAALHETHAYNGVKIMIESKLNVLPVVDEQENYKGSVTQENFLQYLANGTQSMENGGVVVVEATQFNYSLSQISRIFESENVNILSILVHANPSDNLLQLTIKTNKQDLRAVVATLERLNYVVIENYSEHNDNEDLKSNFEGLMNYLKV